MATDIYSNGSGSVQPIEALFARLESDVLDRVFEAYGNFIEVDPVNSRGDALLPLGGVAFSGNFLTYSHVFDVRTTDADLIARLTAAIRKNQQRADYLSQPDEAERRARDEAERRERDRKRDEERARLLTAELNAINRRNAA